MNGTAQRPVTAADVLALAPVVPVVVIDDPSVAVPLARALAAGGVPVVEVTLRTPAALEAIERIAAEVPEVVVGAGTVVTPGQAEVSAAAGAQFLVSPGCTTELLAGARATGLPYLPGVSTVSEAMRLLEAGLTELKLFPAEAVGGRALLASLASPLPQLRFCPTGGIGTTTAADYLALPNVGCVGGSWLTPGDVVSAGDWQRISSLAADAAALHP